MEALLALLLIAVVPFLILGVAFKVLFALVLLPFKILGGLFKAFLGLLGGLFGLVAGGIGLVLGLLVLLVVFVLLRWRPSCSSAGSSGWRSRPSARRPGRPDRSPESVAFRPPAAGGSL